MVGLTGATVSRYEADKQEPALGIIVQLAAALGVAPGWLAFGDAAMEIPINGGAIGGQVEKVPRPPEVDQARRRPA